ncbi:hypothetical protein ACIBEA_39285 [Streptomyces sp. NPDC051555]|uniref:hypothetical protein n=1 Tax=Streptomyces sp. NPDC051555 TaxID=3365657 RepID=UPI00379F30A6
MSESMLEIRSPQPGDRSPIAVVATRAIRPAGTNAAIELAWSMATNRLRLLIGPNRWYRRTEAIARQAPGKSIIGGIAGIKTSGNGMLRR